jgi:hypothetical protein
MHLIQMWTRVFAHDLAQGVGVPAAHADARG